MLELELRNTSRDAPLRLCHARLDFPTAVVMEGYGLLRERGCLEPEHSGEVAAPCLRWHVNIVKQVNAGDAYAFVAAKISPASLPEAVVIEEVHSFF